MKELVCIIICIAFFSCKYDSKQKVDDLYIFDIRTKLAKEPYNPKLSEIAQSIRYVALETNSKCLLKKINYIHINSNYIYACDNNSLYQFTKDGSFVREIGQVGKGVGEHGKRINFVVNDAEGEIYLYSHPKLFNVYDAVTGAFKRDFKVQKNISKFELINNKLILFTIELNAKYQDGNLDEIYVMQ